MALFFPVLSSVVRRMQAGERRFAQRIEAALEDDYLCWYDVGIGPKHLHPDFTLLHPGRGLLVLEVKDWKEDTIRGGDRESFQILTDVGIKHLPNPLEQARQYVQGIATLLEKDPQLRHLEGPHRGRLRFPYGYGVVFTSLTRKQVESMGLGDVIEERFMLCKDDLAPSLDAEKFQEKLWRMFNYQFGSQLSRPQVDRVRYHLWPEIRVPVPNQVDLLVPTDDELCLPDIIRVMDFQQEQLARSLGEGHRVIHGVAGSGKTMILGFRCLHLARLLHKPILVLCFNVTLAAKLRTYVSCQDIDDKVQVYHFHAWCKEQLKTYQAVVPEGSEKIWERQVQGVMRGVERGQIPRGQYGAVLIDEAHDFAPEWLQLITGMVDPASNSLLLLYDDAQSIYHRHGRLGFALSSVGVQARGRTKILKINYRNTKQILQFAYDFAAQYLKEHEGDEDEIPLVRPEPGGVEGQPPVLRQFATTNEEDEFILRCLKKWHDEQHRRWRDIAVVFRAKGTGARLARGLEKAGIPYLLAGDQAAKASYDPRQDRVTLLTMHSSKGLEFPTVIVAGVGEGGNEEDLDTEVRLMYIAMTRAMENLLITTCTENALTGQLKDAADGVRSALA